MFLNLRHPLENNYLETRATPMNGVLRDIFGEVGGGIEDVAAKMWEQQVNMIAAINVAVAAFTQVTIDLFLLKSPNDILGDLTGLARSMGDTMVQLNTIKNMNELLKSNDLTKHAFGELDKFTGGMLTSAQNVSTLPARAARGDAISKQELLRDALFALQVVAVVYGGPAAAGGLLGNLVGREACKNAGGNKDACQVAFTILGAATGSYAADTAGLSNTLTSNSWAGSSADSFEAGAWGDWSDYALNATQVAAGDRLTQEATRQAIALCQTGNWIGDRECAILGQITSNYINAPPGQSWEEFLGQETARLGISLIAEQWFPVRSPEAAAIRKHIIEVNETVPGQTLVYDLGPAGPSNLKAFLLLAGAAGAVLLMGAS